jgi:glyoxylase-like metal-dependent hydrolase (beta-lactamase superfamily II)
MPDSADLSQRLLAQLRFPCGDVPEPGDIKNVAPGIYWLRMPLPFQLNHINLWLVEEKDGWTIVDCGINSQPTRDLWEKIFAEKLLGKPVTRVVATHLHPDHVGLAGWLCARWNAPLLMTLGEYMSAIAARNDFIENEDVRGAHLARNGVPADRIALFHRHKGGYAKGVVPLPTAFQRMIHAHPITLGGHRWDVIVGRGHAPEHASLWCPELNVLIAGDQVLPKISTNVGVWPNEPLADALTWFLDGFSRFRRLPADALVLPSHGFPFIGLHTRLDQLVAHHDARLNDMTTAIARRGAEGATGWDMVPVLFPRHLDNNQVVFAFGETLAHLHCLETRARVKRVAVEGVHRFVALVDANAEPPADDSDAEVMDIGPT